MLTCCCFVLQSCSHTAPLEERIAAADSATAWLAERYGTVSDPRVLRLMVKIKNRLTFAVGGARREHRFDSPVLANDGWHIVVLSSSEPNAFSLGTGVIALTRGMILSCHSEAELAAILAHEMSHELLGHTTMLVQHDPSAPRFHFELDQEIAADTLSVSILRYARYDIRHALGALSIAYRTDDSKVSATPAWLRARAANLEALVAETGDFLPATGTTREFAQMQESLYPPSPRLRGIAVNRE